MKNKDNSLLSKDNKESSILLLQKYSEESFEEPLTGLQASILLDFIEKNIGKFFYNKGVEDSIDLMKEKADDLYLLMKD